MITGGFKAYKNLKRQVTNGMGTQSDDTIVAGGEYLSVEAALNRLHISRSTFDRWRRRYQLPYYKIGKGVFVKESELQEWIGRQAHFQSSPEASSLVIGIQPHTAQTWSGLVVKEFRLLEHELEGIRLRHPITWVSAGSGVELLEGLLENRVQIAYMGDYPIAVSQLLSDILPKFQAVLLAFDGKTRAGEGMAVVARQQIVGRENDAMAVVTVRRSSAERRMDRFVRSVGVREVAVHDFNLTQNWTQMTQSSRVALLMWEPFPSLMCHQGGSKIVWEDSGGEDYLAGIVAHGEWLSTHPEIAQAFLRAHLRAHDLIRRDPDRVARLLARSLQLPKSVVFHVLKRIRWDALIYQHDLRTLGAMVPSAKSFPDRFSVDLGHLADAARQVGLPGFPMPNPGEWMAGIEY